VTVVKIAVIFSYVINKNLFIKHYNKDIIHITIMYIKVK